MTEPGGRPVVDFVVVGAQRSATTHLNSCLRDHPEIFMCADEVPYFEQPFFGRTPPAELAAALAPAAPHQRRGIQRPEYLGRAECAVNIAATAPSAMILAVLRQPVARAISAYFWYMQFRLLPLAPLDVGMERLLDGWADRNYPHAREVLEFGFYGRHLTRYVEAFGADRVLVVLNEDLHDPATFRAIYRSLGVAVDHPPRVINRGTNSGAYDMRRLRFLRARSSLAWSWDSVSEYRYRPRRLRRGEQTRPMVVVAVAG